MKHIHILTFFLLILVGCSGDEADTSEKIIMPIVPDEAIVTFFDTHLPAFGRGECCFFADDKIEKYYLINSRKEFEKISACDNLPEIDFDSYSLIIGQREVPRFSYGNDLVEQTILESTNLTLNIAIKNAMYQSFNTFRHWGIYPKLSKKKKLTVNYMIGNEKI